MKKDHAGVYIPPPFIYLAIFLIAYFTQKFIAIDNSFFQKDEVKSAGILFFLLGLYFWYGELANLFRQVTH
jgi:hypothetical protein